MCPFSEMTVIGTNDFATGGAIVLDLFRVDVGNGNLAAAAIGFGVKGYLLTLDETMDTSPFECRDVHEYIATPVIRLDEAVTLIEIEEFYDSSLHNVCPRK